MVVVVGLLRWAALGPLAGSILDAEAAADGVGSEAQSSQQVEAELDALFDAVRDPAHQTTPTTSPAAVSEAPVRQGGARPDHSTAPLATTAKPPAKPRTPIRVGARKYTGLYHGKGCNSGQLLESLAKAVIRPDGASLRALNHTSDVLPLDEFGFSYDLEGCPTPHVFSPEETCDLLNAFGGVYIRGDSLMRQFAQGVYLLLANSFNIVRDDHEECSGNRVFTSGKECKFHSHFDGRNLEQVCGERVAILYQQLFSWIEGPVDDDYKKSTSHKPISKPTAKTLVKRKRPSVAELGGRLQAAYKSFIASLSAEQHKLSPVYIHGTGIHYYFDTGVSEEYHIGPWMETAAAASPRPVSLWILNPAPGKNKPKQFEAGQGETATQKYNQKMKVVLAKINGREQEVAKGAWSVCRSVYVLKEASQSFVDRPLGCSILFAQGGLRLL